jgi:hypothetical protein
MTQRTPSAAMSASSVSLAGRGYPIIKTIPVIDGFGVDHHQSISRFTRSSTLRSIELGRNSADN